MPKEKHETSSYQLIKQENESPEQFRDRILQTAQEIYASEVKTLDKKISQYEKLLKLSPSFIIPTSLYMAIKFLSFNDMELEPGIPETVDKIMEWSWIISLLSTGVASAISIHLEEKLKWLKKKFGLLAAQEEK